MSRNITKVHYVNHEFLDYDTVDGKAVTECKLDYQIFVKDIPQFNNVFTVEFIKYVCADLSGQIIFDKEDRRTPISIKFLTIGKATCSPNDKYDAKLGENIALTKCQANAFITANKVYQKIEEILYNRYAREIQKLVNSSREAAIREINHLNEITQ